MTIEQLNYVIEIVKAGSISAAANQLFISRTVLSSAVSRLEEELGQKLFIRTSKGIHLTPFGKLFLDHIRPLHLQLSQLQAFSGDRGEKKSDVYTVVSNGFPLVTAVLSRMSEHFAEKDLTVNHYETYEVEVPVYVADNLASVGVIRVWDCYLHPLERQFETQGLDFFPLAELNIGITVGKNHPFFSRKGDTILREELSAFPFAGYLSQDKGPYADIFHRIAVVPPVRKMITTSRAALYEILMQTDAYTLDSVYPEDIIHTQPGGIRDNLRTFRLENCDVHSVVGWLMKQTHIMNKPDHYFLEELQRYFR
ncbi:MAG: LysR family transcriptional regulator [Anaerovoracaceae bacterium]